MDATQTKLTKTQKQVLKNIEETGHWQGNGVGCNPASVRKLAALGLVERTDEFGIGAKPWRLVSK